MMGSAFGTSVPGGGRATPHQKKATGQFPFLQDRSRENPGSVLPGSAGTPPVFTGCGGIRPRTSPVNSYMYMSKGPPRQNRKPNKEGSGNPKPGSRRKNRHGPPARSTRPGTCPPECPVYRPWSGGSWHPGKNGSTPQTRQYRGGLKRARQFRTPSQNKE